MGMSLAHRAESSHASPFVPELEVSLRTVAHNRAGRLVSDLTLRPWSLHTTAEESIDPHTGDRVVLGQPWENVHQPEGPDLVEEPPTTAVHARL